MEKKHSYSEALEKPLQFSDYVIGEYDCMKDLPRQSKNSSRYLTGESSDILIEIQIVLIGL